MKRWIPVAVFAAITLCVFWRFLVYGETLYAHAILEHQRGAEKAPENRWFPSERMRHTIPDNILLLPSNLNVYNEGLKSGELRLWNPQLLCGYPLYANPMVQPFYPPHLVLHAVLHPDDAYQWSLLLHLFFSGLAMYWALRAMSRGVPAATIGGVAWMLFGYNAMWFTSVVLAGAAVFAPLTLLFIVRGLERKDESQSLPAAIAMGMTILGSHPQHAIHVFLFFVGWLLFAALRTRRERRFVARFSILFVVFTLGVAMVAILARLDTIANGYRAAAETAGPLYERPWKILLFLPSIVAGKVHFPDLPVFQYEFASYAGLALAAMAFVGAIRGFGNPQVRFAAIFGAAALMVAFVAPLASVLGCVPILNLSPASRWIFVFGFCLPIVAAYGVDVLANERTKVPWVILGATLVYLLLCVLRVRTMHFGNPAAVETLIGFALLLAASFVPIWLPRIRYAAALAAVLFELLPPFLYYAEHTDNRLLNEVPEQVSFLQERDERPWRTGGMLASGSSEGLASYEISLGANMLGNYGAEHIGGFEAIMPAHYLIFAAEAGGIVKQAGRGVGFVRFDSPHFDVMAMKYLFMPVDMDIPPKFELLKSWGRLRLYENTAAVPRVTMTSRILVADGPEKAAEILKSKDFKPGEAVVLETGALPELPSGEPIPCEVEWLDRTPDYISLKVKAPQTGVLVLADSWYPGWAARVNGEETPILRANLAFRAIPLLAGMHKVEFTFRPASVGTGLPVSLLFLLAAVGWFFVLRRRWMHESATTVAPDIGLL